MNKRCSFVMGGWGVMSGFTSMCGDRATGERPVPSPSARTHARLVLPSMIGSRGEFLPFPSG